ncbi:CRE_HP_G0073260.mRNA.1.CDS.1 [Saccharomyces cerevisiae]|nr:CRE_HP_G0073260.mRNA.1.CDS.1 [Saccharomyces cerevisiae]CAI6899448.1 CRE_HP_G0073260.mRNA.1.CDS.1 [Saccharomyces cerevisiae]
MFFALFFLLAVTFLLYIANFTGEVGVTRAGGVLGVIVAFIAWYNAYAGIATRQNSYIMVHPFALPSNDRCSSKHAG